MQEAELGGNTLSKKKKKKSEKSLEIERNCTTLLTCLHYTLDLDREKVLSGLNRVGRRGGGQQHKRRSVITLLLSFFFSYRDPCPLCATHCFPSPPLVRCFFLFLWACSGTSGNRSMLAAKSHGSSVAHTQLLRFATRWLLVPFAKGSDGGES